MSQEVSLQKQRQRLKNVNKKIQVLEQDFAQMASADGSTSSAAGTSWAAGDVSTQHPHSTRG